MIEVAIDTNILVYAEGHGDERRAVAALACLERLLGRIVIPVQVLGELCTVLTRRALRSSSQVEFALRRWEMSGRLAELSSTDFWDALALAHRHGLQIWDAIIVVAAQRAGCALLLSEHMQHGFVWRSITVVNPFADPIHPLLQSAIADGP